MSKPIVVRHGDLRARIYPYRNNGSTYYHLTWYAWGKRRSTTVASLAKARALAASKLSAVANGEPEVSALSNRDADEYRRSKALLEPLGVSVEFAVHEWLRRHPGNIVQKPTDEIITEMIVEKAQDGRNLRYLSELRRMLTDFSSRFPPHLHEISGSEVDRWLRSQDFSPRTRLNYRTSLRTLEAFAKRKGYLPPDWGEFNAIARPTLPPAKPLLLTPAELTSLLQTKSQALRLFIAIGAFAGLRSAEISRLDWSEVRAEWIEVTAAKAKTRSRRLVPLLTNLAEWLAPQRKHTGPVIHIRYPTAHLDRYAKARGLTWGRNALRHSWISYRLAITQNAHQVALEAGNSPEMVFRVYRELCLPETAREWFSIRSNSLPFAPITPKNCANNCAKSRK